MKTKLLFFVSAFFLLIGLTIFSCSKKPDPCSSCNAKPDGSKIISVKFSTGSIEAKTNYYTGINSSEPPDFQIGLASLENNAFKDLSHFLIRNTGLDQDPFVVVLYFTNYFTKTDVISENDFLGFSAFYQNNNKMYHSLFKKDGENYKIVPELSLEVSVIKFKELNFIIESVLKNDARMNCSYLVLRDESYKLQPLNHPRNTFSLHLPSLIKIYDKSGTKATESCVGCGGDVCGAPCLDHPQNSFCTEDENGTPGCAPNLCYLSAQTQVLLDNSKTLNPPNLYEAIESSLLYSFRDSVMTKYNIGRKYINYYYAVSDYLGNDVPLSLAISTAEFFLIHNDDISKLINSSGHMQDTLINSAFKSDILSLISEYKDLSNDSVYLSLFNNLNNDVVHFHGKTVQEILDEIK